MLYEKHLDGLQSLHKAVKEALTGRRNPFGGLLIFTRFERVSGVPRSVLASLCDAFTILKTSKDPLGIEKSFE